MRMNRLRIPLLLGIALLSLLLIRGHPTRGEEPDSNLARSYGDNVITGFWASEANTEAPRDSQLSSISLNAGGEIQQQSTNYRIGLTVGQLVAARSGTRTDSCDCNPGDCNNDGVEDIDDVVAKINFIFAGGSTCTPYPLCNCDYTCDCVCDIDDVVAEVQYIFQGGPPPCTCLEWVAACGWPLRE